MATPPKTDYEFVRSALEAGTRLVENRWPTTAEAAELIALADVPGQVLMPRPASLQPVHEQGPELIKKTGRLGLLTILPHG